MRACREPADAGGPRRSRACSCLAKAMEGALGPGAVAEEPPGVRGVEWSEGCPGTLCISSLTAPAVTDRVFREFKPMLQSASGYFSRLVVAGEYLQGSWTLVSSSTPTGVRSLGTRDGDRRSGVDDPLRRSLLLWRAGTRSSRYRRQTSTSLRQSALSSSRCAVTLHRRAVLLWPARWAWSSVAAKAGHPVSVRAATAGHSPNRTVGSWNVRSGCRGWCRAAVPPQPGQGRRRDCARHCCCVGSPIDPLVSAGRANAMPARLLESK